jgi:hypothetical protein
MSDSSSPRPEAGGDVDVIEAIVTLRPTTLRRLDKRFVPGFACKICGCYWAPGHDTFTVEHHDSDCTASAIRAQLTALRARLEEGERWIPVSERLPDNNRVVLGCSDGGTVKGCMYVGKRFIWDEFDWPGEPPRIVAWRELPKPYSLPPSGGTE